ncbi:MAG: hypothetical protein COS84_04575, partial [Armatimonadetes bacterium CG07_land_8_20_14_0_80_40_9]
KEYKPVTDGVVKIWTRYRNDDVDAWTPAWGTGTDYGLANASGYGEGTITDDCYRYLQFLAQLKVTGSDFSRSPLLATVTLYNAASNSYYEVGNSSEGGGQAGWEAADNITNLSTTASPGNLLLEAGVGDNLVLKEETSAVNLGKDTYYAGNIWTQIRWAAGSSDWPGDKRLWRRKITLTNNTSRMRFNEPYEVIIT